MNLLLSLKQRNAVLLSMAKYLDEEREAKATILEEAARREIAVLDLVFKSHDIRQLYGAGMVLIRPDQIIGWRGSECANPVELWQLLMGQPVSC